MSNKKTDPARAAHHAGDQDLDFNGSGSIPKPVMMYVPDPRVTSDQPFYEIQSGKRGSIEGSILLHTPQGPLDFSFGESGRYTFPFMDTGAVDTILDCEGFIFSNHQKLTTVVRNDQVPTTITCVGVSEFVKIEDGVGRLVNVPAAVRISATGQLDTDFGTVGKQLYKSDADTGATKDADSEAAKDVGAEPTKDAYSEAPKDVDSKASEEEQLPLPTGQFNSPWNSTRITVQQSGEILFPCRLINKDVTSFHLVRLDAKGLPVDGYGDVGYKGVQTITPTSDRWADYAVGSDGNITLAGNFNNGTALGVVSRYTSAGKLDTQFAGGRKIIDLSDVPGVSSIQLKRIWSGDDDGVTIHANIYNNIFFKDQLVIIKLTKSGEYDPAFQGGRPLVVRDVDASQKAYPLMEIDNLQRMVITYGYTPYDARLVRLLKNGNPDYSFGKDSLDGSIIHPNIGPVTDLIIQNGVDILLKGYLWVNGNSSSALYRFFGESAA